MFGTLGVDARDVAKGLGIVVGRTYWSYNKGRTYRVVSKVELNGEDLVVHYTDMKGRPHNCLAPAFCEWTKALNTRKKRRSNGAR